MKGLKHYLLLSILLFVSCNKDSEVITPESLSDNARSYLNSALDIMQNHSINRYKIDWVTFRQNTLEYAGNAQNEKDTYDAIKYAIKNLGDNHSSFIIPQSSSNITTIPFPYDERIKTMINKISSDPFGMKINSEIGFIRIPAFSGSAQLATNFAVNIQKIISTVDTITIKGWIVDLRHNTGGNMWPMLAGVGPILGEGLVGKFIDPDNNISNWYYENGSSKNDNVIITAITNCYRLFNPNPFVAVLTDNLTASSGEAITVAFIGRNKTKSFGDYTYGVSTANAGYPLRDGAIINLTVSTFADRNGTLYGGKIEPDEFVVAPLKNNPTDSDSVVNIAVKWLKSNL